MIIVDAQLSPAIATWINQQFGPEAVALRDLGLRDATDRVVFDFARERGAIVMTKDSDFVSLVQRHGSPPQIIWLTCGNTSNAALRLILAKALSDALALLAQGEPLVEIA
jgi:predicted nuclease of predicted toxin-antitoxin system